MPDDAWRLRKARSLVKLLALAPEHRIHRERACELLWPGRDARSAANNLHQALHAARRALDAAGGDGLESLTLQQGMLALENVSTDVDRYLAAAAAARQSGGVGAYWEAAGLYTGTLLPEDLYEDWATARRESLREQQTSLLVEVARIEREGGHAAAAGEALEQALAVDELHEPATRELMGLLTAEGRRQEALAAYQRLRNALRSSLEADPDPETRRLYRTLLASSLAAADGSEVAEARPSRRHNLPHEPSSFIGRENELREIGRRLDRARLLTLTGAGGVGKTRLAQEAAASCVDQFEHGVWLAELAALSDEVLIASAIGAAVGLDLPDGRPPLAALVEQLADRHALIVLDNCEHLIEACAAVATEILRACPGVSVLATSRQPLRIDGEVAWRVPSLALPDPDDLPALAELQRLESVRFFCERAAAVVPGFSLDDDNARAVAELCVRLDGVPLALELAAARIALLSPAELAERLVGTLDALGEGSRVRLTRQRTLTATLDWSHDLLDDDERALFRRLAVFAGTFSLEAVEGVCAVRPLERATMIHPLGRLVDKSLVVVERDEQAGARYRLLETVRQYAHQRLREAGELEALERNHLDWYAAFAQAHDPELATDRLTEKSWVVEAEHDNLRAALREALASAPEDALTLATSLWRFWLARGHFAEGRRWLDAALQAAPAPAPARARALNAAAVLDMRRGDFTHLEEMGDEVIGIYRQVDDPVGMAQVLHFAGIWDWGRDNERQRIEESAALARQVGATHVLAAVEHSLGLIELGRGETGSARKHVERSRELIDELDDLRHSFLPALTLGWMPEPGDGAHPRVIFAETVVLGHRLGTQHGPVFLQSTLAWIAWREDDLERAHELASDSAERFHHLGWDYGEALALSLVGNVQRRRGEFDAAERSLTRSLDLRRALGDRRATGVALGNLGVLLAARGDLSGAYRTHREALELFERTEDGPGTAGTLLNMARTAERAGDIVAARDLLEQSLEGRMVFGAGSATGWMSAMAAELAAREGDAEKAGLHLDDARAIFDQVGDRAGLEACVRVAAGSS